MTEKEKILGMKPGKELDMMVAEKVLGLVITKDDYFGYMERRINPKDGGSVWAPVDVYSQDMKVASLVIDTMIEKGYKDAMNWANFGDGKYTEAEAVCKAALLKYLEEQTLEERSDNILRQALGDDK